MNKENRERISQSIQNELGISLEEAEKMDLNEFHKLIEQKSGQKMKWSRPRYETRTADEVVDEILTKNKTLRRR